VGSRRTSGTGCSASKTLQAKNSSLWAPPGWVRIVSMGVIKIEYYFEPLILGRAI
jgi:hypothetical protein